MSPVKTFPTSGLPTGVCMKPLGDRRVFVVAGRDAPQLSVYDVDSFEHLRDIPLTGLEFVDYLAASANPNDPYVYFSTQSIKETKVQRTSNDGPPSTADRLGRVNLLTGEQSPNTTASFNDITVSPDGQRLWARFTANTASVSGEWEHLQNFTGNSDDVTIYLKRDPPARAPMRFLGDQVASNRFIFSPTLRVFRAETDFYPGAVFEHRPILVGTNDKGIVFASANDYRQLATIPLPDPWISKYSQEDVVDFRQRGVAGASLQTPFLDVQADSRRERAVLTTGNLLLISPLSFVKLPDEPSLALRTELPERIAPDEPFEIPLETVVPIEGAVIEAVHNSDWLPDEEQTIVGQDAPGKRSPLPLALKQDMRKDSNSVILTNYDFLEGMSYPFWLRVGREMMRVRKRADFALMVQRTMQIGHSTEERVAVIDNSGREMPIGPPEKRGIRLELRAALSDDQDWILVNDLRALKEQPLPAEMVVGSETMTLLSIDEFKNTLQVKRPKPKGHSVSDKVVVMKPAESDSQSSLVPNVRDGKLSWTPTSAQLGRQTVRLRVRTGALSRDWFWEVRVERTDGAAPRLAANTSGKNTPDDGKAGGGDKGGPGSAFHVLGIEPLRGSKLGVIWGQSKPPHDNLPGGAIPTSPDGKYYLGVCDVTTGAVLRHKELSQPISAATIHSTGIYAATPLDGLPPSNLAPKRSQIVRYDGETLEPISEVEVSCPVYRLQTIADRYLSAPGVRLQIPDLTGAAPVEFPMPLTSAGRCRSGWVWDGVLWDEAMQKPQLILMPGLLSPLSEQQQNAGLASAPGGTIRITPNSCYTCTFGPLNTPFEGEFPLVSLPGAISSGRGVVRIHSWADASKFAGRSLPTLKSATLFEEMKLPLELRPLFLRMSAGYVAEGDGMAHVAVMGRLYRVPLPQPNETSQEFRFVEQQSALSLPASTFNKVSYSAPGAVRYQLELRHDRAPSDLELPAIVGLESNDGNFELPQFDIDALIAHLFSRLRLDNVTVRVDQKIEAITSHTKRYNRVFKQLTGRPLKGIPTFVYASVVAEHGDGQSKAGLSHCYILEIPAEYVRDAIWR